MNAKKEVKVAVFLTQEMAAFIDRTRPYEITRAGFMRGLVYEKMNRMNARKQSSLSNDPFDAATITANLIPNDLKEYAELFIEWWPIRKQKGGVNSTRVANRLFDTLRSFPSQDRKEALEKAITAGWKDIYPLKKGYKPEESKNNHPASRVFTADRGFID